PRRARASLSRRTPAPRAPLRAGRRPAARGDLARLAGLQRVPRRGLDAGALPELRPPGHRLRGLPVPGVRPGRRPRADRPRLRALAPPRPDRGRTRGGAGGGRHPAGPARLSRAPALRRPLALMDGWVSTRGLSILGPERLR